MAFTEHAGYTSWAVLASDLDEHERAIVTLPGRVEGGVVETADIFTSVDGVLVRAQGFPPHPDKFAQNGIDLPELLADSRDLDSGWRQP